MTETETPTETAAVTAPPFNLRAWLGEAVLPTETVTVYGRADLSARINELEVQLAAASRERSMRDKGPGALRRELDELRGQYEASALKVTVRARKLGDLAKIEAAMKAAGENPADAEAFNVYGTVQWAVSPAMDAATVRDLADAIGAPQFEKIVAAWNDLASKCPEPSVPLSPRP